MVPAIQPTVQLFEVSQHLFRRALKDLEPESLKRHPEGSNPMIWLAAHVTHARIGLSKITGGERQLLWRELFGRHSQSSDEGDYPDLSEIQKVFAEVTDELAERFGSLTEEELAKPSGYDAPIEDKSVAGTITFFAYHESYHIGQMAYVRKWLGRGGIIDG